MNLKEIRNQFVELSGRHDLVDVEVPVTANMLINSGSEYLDRKSAMQKTYATCYRFLGISGWNVQIPFCRAVKEVWVANTTSRWQLEKYPLQDLLTGLMTEKVTLLETGVPLYYAPVLTRVVGNIPIEINNYIDYIVSQGNNFNAVLILPPSDAKTLVEVRGMFYSDKLSADSDSNLWSEVHPTLLIMAALRSLEIFQQNPDRVRAWEATISNEMAAINMDLVEEQIAEVSEMEG